MAVCAAVAHEPQLLLADEPTGELDERSAGEVYDLLARIAADGTGVILVSHDPRAVASTDRAVRIRDGRAAEQWRPGSAVVEQLPDSRGWIRVPRERLPELDPVPPLEARRTEGGLLLVPRAPAETVPDLPSRSLPAPERPAYEVLADLTGLAAGYGDRTLFDRLDLVLRSGTWTAVTGPSGSGKSTLISVIAGLLPPLAGTVIVGDGPWDGLVARCPGRAPPPMGGAAAPAAGHARGAHRTREPAAHRGHPWVRGRAAGHQPSTSSPNGWP